MEQYKIILKPTIISTLKFLPMIFINSVLLSSLFTSFIIVFNLYQDNLFIEICSSLMISGFFGSLIKRFLLAELFIKRKKSISVDSISGKKAIINILITYLILIFSLKIFGVDPLISIILGIFLLIGMLILQII